MKRTYKAESMIKILLCFKCFDKLIESLKHILNQNYWAIQLINNKKKKVSLIKEIYPLKKASPFEILVHLDSKK